MLIFFFLSCHHVAVYLSTGEEDSMVPKQWVEHTRDRLGQSAIIITYRGLGAQAVGGEHQVQTRSVRHYYYLPGIGCPSSGWRTPGTG